jgi:hypothetical protein
MIDILVQPWEEVLDDMERRVALAERTLAGEPVRLPQFDLPASIGPLPAYLRERARAVLAATRRVEERMEVGLGALALRIYELDAARAAVAASANQARPAPIYVDRWA